MEKLKCSECGKPKVEQELFWTGQVDDKGNECYVCIDCDLGMVGGENEVTYGSK